MQLSVAAQSGAECQGSVARVAPAGELKQLTILFADLAGSTKLCEGLDPEQVHELINAWVQLVSEDIYRHGGIVTEFAGDAVMAIFGAPVAYEDAPQRACRAALAAQQRLRELNARRNVPLQMRIGIDTGESFVGAVGGDLRSDYTALGHRANLAKRVQEVAERGSVTVSGETHDLVQPYFRTIEAGEFPAKGLTRPLRVYRILGEAPARSRLDVTLSRWQPRLVGRERQLDQLRRHIADLKSGKTQLVAIEGEPGIGKSRLALELENMAAEQALRLWQGRAQPYAEKQAYAVFADAVRRACAIEVEDSIQVARRKLQALGAYFENDLPFLEALLSVESENGPLRQLDPEARKAGLFAAVRRLIRAQAAEAPFLLLLDDFHWADQLSRELTDFVVAGAQDLPLFVCLVSRPGDWGLASIRHFSRIALAVLTPAESTEMTLSLLSLNRDEDGISFCSWVHSISGGNPLFVEEVLQSLLSEGVLAPADQGWRVVGDLRRVYIPGSVQDLIASRIDRLPAEQKEILQHAAVVGHEFSSSVLEAVSGASEVSTALADLVRHEFIVQAGASYAHDLSSDRSYAFKHGLTWQVAYGSMPRTRRAPIHERIADLLERLHRDDLERHYALLAHHYDLSPNTVKAVAYLRRAAEAAATAYANEDAVAHLSKALQRGEQVLGEEEKMSLLISRGTIRSRLLADYQGALSDFDAGAAIACAAGRRRMAARALIEKGKAFMRQYRSDDAIRWMDQALEQTEGEPCCETADALLQKGFNLTEKAVFQEAESCLERAFQLCQQLGEKGLQVQALSFIGRLRMGQNQFEAALQAYDACIALASEIRDSAALSLALHNQGLVYLAQQDYARFEAVNGRSRHLFEEVGDKRMLAYSLMTRGTAAQIQGRHSEAVDCYESALQHLHDLGVRNHSKVAKSIRLLLCTPYEKLERAREQLHNLEELLSLERHEDPRAGADLLHEIAEVCLRAGLRERALEALSDAAKLHLDSRDYLRARNCLDRIVALELGGSETGLT